jgi:hypothetical protein
MGTLELPDRGFKFIPAVMQYSGGVAALPGHRLLRVRFMRTLPMAQGFAAIAAWLDAHGLPRTAFCGCELRSPAPFTEDGFRAFNTVYAGTLRDWGVLLGDGTNPVARSNVCPAIDPPSEPGFHAFAVAGSGEAPEGRGTYTDHIIARGDVSPAGLRAKAHWVLAEMERRMRLLGFGWADATAAQAYTVHDLTPVMQHLVVPRGAGAHGLTWHLCRPPVEQLEFEMDVRGIFEERVVAA